MFFRKRFVLVSAVAWSLVDCIPGFSLHDKLQRFDLNSRDPPANGDLDMAYVRVGPEDTSAVSFSICAKCGSTSLFNALYTAVYGTPFKNVNKSAGPPKPPWVHAWTKWPKSGRPEGSMLMYAGHLRGYPRIEWLHFHVYRDPVERYISTYFSKLRCCGAELPGVAPSAQNRTVCAQDARKSRPLTSDLRRRTCN